MDDDTTAGNTVYGSRRIWVPLAVVGVLFALAAGEALAAKASPDDRELAADTVISFGGEKPATVKAGEGWTLDSGASDLHSGLLFTRGDMTVQLTSVTFPAADTSPTQMWAGFSSLLNINRYKGAEVRLGDPAEFDTPSISGGQRADIHVDAQAGTAFVLPDSDQANAVEVTALAPPQANQDAWDAASTLIASIAFDGEDA